MSAAVFGKLPAHGDFIARGLDAAARDGLDTWLAGSLAQARARLGEEFDPLWEQAPPWRFGQVIEGAGTAGAIAPSVDAVGRRFPLLVLRREIAADAVEAAAQQCEDLLFEALGGGWSADDLAAAVAALGPPPGDREWTGGALWWTEGSGDFAPARIAGDRPPGLIDQMLTMEAEA